MAERVLTQRELNRAALARQLLLERARVPLARALERVGGIQNQYAASGYVGLWTRVQGFRRDALTRALARRSVVQGTLMRDTIHLVSAREYWLYAMGVRRARREWALRIDKSRTDAEMRKRARAVRQALGEGREPDVRGQVMLWVDVVRVPPSGTWERRRADRYALAEDWIGPCDVTEEEGLDHLLRTYLRSFGPAPLADAANWAGVPTRFLEPSLARLELRRFRDDAGKELLDVPRAPLPRGDTPAPVRFLPHFDSCLWAHLRRAEILPEEYRPRILTTKNPIWLSGVLVDGRVAAAWGVRDARVVVEPFEPLPPEVEEERERLQAFYD